MKRSTALRWVFLILSIVALVAYSWWREQEKETYEWTGCCPSVGDPSITFSDEEIIIDLDEIADATTLTWIPIAPTGLPTAEAYLNGISISRNHGHPSDTYLCEVKIVTLRLIDDGSIAWEWSRDPLCIAGDVVWELERDGKTWSYFAPIVGNQETIYSWMRLK